MSFRKLQLLLLAACASIIAARAAHAANTVVYTYDSRGHISSAAYDNGVIIYYVYDADGNRISQTTKVNSSGLSWTTTATPCSSNCWGGALWQ